MENRLLVVDKVVVQCPRATVYDYCKLNQILKPDAEIAAAEKWAMLLKGLDIHLQIQIQSISPEPSLPVTLRLDFETEASIDEKNDTFTWFSAALDPPLRASDFEIVSLAFSSSLVPVTATASSGLPMLMNHRHLYTHDDGFSGWKLPVATQHSTGVSLQENSKRPELLGTYLLGAFA